MSTGYATKNLPERLDKILCIFVLVSVFCLIFVIAHRAIFDPDIWLHLKTGEFILHNKVIPSQDIFSFTVQGKRWIDHSWLFQVICYMIYSHWQADGLIFLQSLIIVLSFLILFLMGKGIITSYLEIAILILLTAYASMTRFNIRPDIFSMLFFAIYLYLLRFHIDKKRLWLLMFIQALWVNLHGYFFLGPLLVFLFVSAEFLRRKIKFLPWQWKEEFALSDSSYNRLKRLLPLTILVCFLNPNGIRGALYPLYVFREVILGHTQIFFKYIIELRPTLAAAKLSGMVYYKLMAIFCILLMAVNFKRLKIIEILLVTFFFFFSLTLRNMPFFTFVSYTVIICYFSEIIKKIYKNIKKHHPSWQKFYIFSTSGLAAILLVFILPSIGEIMNKEYYDFNNQRFQSTLFGIDREEYPEKAVDFLLANAISPQLFNDFNSGAYLIGRAYPKIKVFIDGRTELYGPEFFKDYQNIIDGDLSVFEKIVNKYNLNTVLFCLTPMANIIKHIYRSPQWKLVFFDDLGVVFLKDTPSTQELIPKYKINLDKYSASKADLYILGIRRIYPAPYIRRASLLYHLEEMDAAITEAKEALRIMPDCFRAYHLLGKAYLYKKSYQEALENLRAAALLFPENAEVLFDLGMCLKELKENKAAINAFRGAIKFNRRYASAYCQLGCIYLTINNETEAIQALGKAVIYDSKNYNYHFKLGNALFDKGKRLKDRTLLMKARQELQEAFKLGNQDKELIKEIEDKLK